MANLRVHESYPAPNSPSKAAFTTTYDQDYDCDYNSDGYVCNDARCDVLSFEVKRTGENPRPELEKAQEDAPSDRLLSTIIATDKFETFFAISLGCWV
uniref:Uncharacterized protein n=1 Tax=Steinernema glaseri TaxID=37863 RepID=A0A1I7Y7B1_9BILA